MEQVNDFNFFGGCAGQKYFYGIKRFMLQGRYWIFPGCVIDFGWKECKGYTVRDLTLFIIKKIIITNPSVCEYISQIKPFN